MPYIIDYDSYEFHPGDEQLPTTLTQSMLGFYIIHMMKGSLVYINMCNTYVNDHI
jgi:hypothetical protein